MLAFSSIELIDLFFRFSAVGILLFINFIWLDKHASVPLWITRSLLICLSGYLLLTAPIDDEMYGHFRGLVLLLTELLPYCFWLYVFVFIKPETRFKDIHWIIRVFVCCLFLWMFYFFAVLQGRGSFHQINHVLGIVLYCHIAFMAIYDLQDDLVQHRRTSRVVMAIFFGAYSTFLALLEIFDNSLRAEPLFSIINSSTIFAMIFLFSILVAKAKNSVDQCIDDLPISTPKVTTHSTVPVIFRADLEKLNMLMEPNFYSQSNFTIGVLAEALGMPEHRLRLLINKHLSHQNFSMFLNSYRIPAAIEMLKNPQHFRLPVLSIALDLGYGSIGPFNRAFKGATGFTPSEYRKNFQNQT